MRIGVPRETAPGETRVAATPASVEKLRALGYDVLVETGAGALAAFPDEVYVAAGARLGSAAEALDSDVVLKINAPSDVEIDALRDGAVLASLISPALKPELVQRLAGRPVTVLAMDAVPRISRAQALDVLSSMANIGGYRAVIEAAHEFGSLFTGQVTAAGKVPPATVLVIGAGVAGLAAIGTAGSLGAVVRAFDARPEVGEQVRSMGATFLEVERTQEELQASSDGYAKQTTADFEARAAALYAAQAREVDIIVTTALIPGRPAPRLITAEMVASMKPGSVVVDMAAANGGNCELTRAGEVVTSPNGVKVIGYTDLPGRLPTQASQLFATNLVNLLKLLTPGKDGQVVLDLEDQVQRGMTVVRDGEVLWPPPPVQVSAAAAAPAAAPPPRPEKAPPSAVRGAVPLVVGVLALLLVTALAPGQLAEHLTVLTLSVVIGFYVIGNVAHALHTPLMSVTNAISGVILVGAMLQVTSDRLVVQLLAALAVLLVSINVVGGFAVTRRMLSMFSRG
ncbi:Re/Si-specific NAD(P)(+) transhydrogenase subunit alpha [Lapillicoccus jejuensis]|uniref:NAD(P) transhydrogenase subunit alpha n=1 Tax=Lapillicoccus jejuensis TaxID=402171 RepID=A0A542DY99_9MICO|nr:Re/Si-specific NAD(P)(+) transhydrogenase subunit alpha [Lapillicoccus jejuensis]TQJ08016.1 NAD(P) transhydrogenase subunit alpha [Lapillicoccus jejuensis]